MKPLIAALLPALLVAQSTPHAAPLPYQEAAKTIQQSQKAPTPLTNEDVLRMVRAGFTPETVVAQIKASACDFATTPEALMQLKEEKVPDAVILAMAIAPKVSAAAGHHAAAQAQQRPVNVRVPNGLPVEVEAPFTINSQQVRKGEAISFRVVNPVKVDGLVVIAPGATATARLVQAERGGHFGRAGRLAWVMESVTGVDGTKIPLQSGGRIVGDSKGAKVATQTILVGAVLGIFAPLSLLHGFKRGENAYLPAGKRFEVFVQGEAVTVVAAAPAGQ